MVAPLIVAGVRVAASLIAKYGRQKAIRMAKSKANKGVMKDRAAKSPKKSQATKVAPKRKRIKRATTAAATATAAGSLAYVASRKKARGRRK